MKKSIFTFLFTVFACAPNAPGMAHLMNLDLEDPNHIIKKLKTRTTLNFCIEIFDKAENSGTYYNLTESALRGSFTEWTIGIAFKIRDAGRRQEFEDILPILEKNFEINIEPCSQLKTYDLALAVFDNEDYSRMPPEVYRARYFEEGRHPEIQMRKRLFERDAAIQFGTVGFGKKPDPLYPVIMHELGHHFGLADQYKLGNSSMQYASHKSRPTIMDKQKKRNKKIMCDDIDGIVTLMDRFYDTGRTFYSLCGDGVEFTNGIEVIGKEFLRIDKKIPGQPWVVAYVLTPDTSKNGVYTRFHKRVVEFDEDLEHLKKYFVKIKDYPYGKRLNMYTKQTVDETNKIRKVERIYDFGKEKIYITYKFNYITDKDYAYDYATNIHKKQIWDALRNFPILFTPNMNVEKMEKIFKEAGKSFPL